MRIALISATKLSLQPIEYAMNERNTNLEFFHLLDTSLIYMLKSDGCISERIYNRFKSLCDISMENGADCIQLTCSAFNDVTDLLKNKYKIPIYRSDEGMVKKVLSYKKIGIVSTFAETPLVLKNYIEKHLPKSEIIIQVNTELMKDFEAGNKNLHDAGVLKMIESLQDSVDVILLAQYSIAHVAKMKAFNIPVITAPDASIGLCLTNISEVES